MKNKKKQKILKISSFYIITAYIFIFSAALAQTQPLTDPNEEMIVLNKNTVVQKIFKLKYYGLSQMAQIIEPLLSDEGYLDGNEGLLKVTDKVSVLLNLENIINKFDVATEPDFRQQIFVVHNRDPYEIVKLVQIIVKNKLGTGSTSKSEEDPVVLIPVPEKNWIIARASAKNMKTIEEWITKLDSGNPPDKLKDIPLSEIKDANQIVEKFFYFHNKSPEEIARQIKPLLSKNGYLSAEENTGTILVIDKVSVLLEIEKLINKLDFPKIDPNEPMVSVNFSSLDINEIVRTLSNWTGKTVIPSKEAMNITIMVYSPEKMPRDKAINLLNAALMHHGFVTEEIDNIIYIKPGPPPKGFQVQLLGPDEPLEKIKDKNMIVRKIFKLNYYNTGQMAQIILPFLSSYGYITSDESSNTLMIMDSVGTLMRIQQLIKLLDSENSTESSEPFEISGKDPNEEVTEPNISKNFQLKYTKPSEMKEILEPLISKQGYINADNETKTLLIADDTETLKRLEKIIIQFDVPHASFKQVGFFEIRNSEPNELAKLIQLILKQQTDANSPSHTAATGRPSSRTSTRADANSIKTSKIVNEAEGQNYETLQFNNVDVNEAAAKLANILDEMGGPFARYKIDIQNPVASKIIVVYGDDKIRELARNILNIIDNKAFIKAEEYDIIPIKNDDVNEVANSLYTVLNEIKSDYKNKINIVPIPKCKILLIFGNKDYCEIIRKELKNKNN